MSITQYTAAEKVAVYTNEALWIYGASHVIDVSLAGSLESSVITPSECVQNPGQPILWEMKVSCVEQCITTSWAHRESLGETPCMPKSHHRKQSWKPVHKLLVMVVVEVYADGHPALGTVGRISR